jgi:hypothetical protein
MNPGRLDELNDAIRVIASYRDCYILNYFTTHQQLPSFTDSMDVDKVDLPAGLNNIGNTYVLCADFLVAI